MINETNSDSSQKKANTSNLSAIKPEEISLENKPIQKKNKASKNSIFLHNQFSAEMSINDFRYFLEPFTEIQDNASSINLGPFIETTIYHILFFIVMGPLVSLFISLFYKNLIYAKNLGFWGLNPNCVQQSMVFFFNFVGIYCYYFLIDDVTSIYPIEIYMLLSGIICRCFLIAAKYGLFPKRKMQYVRYKLLTNEEIHFEFMLNWYRQGDDFVEKELWASLGRNQIEEGYFIFYFLRPLNPELRSKLKVMTEYEKEFRKSTNNPDPYKLFGNVDYYMGISIARYLIKKYKTSVSLKKILIFSLFASIIHAFIPIFYRIAMDESLFGKSNLERLVIVCIFLSNIYHYWLNFAFIIIGVFEYDRPIKLLSQLSNLLSIKTVENYHVKKIFPTMNFFCIVTLRSWYSLNKIIRSYGLRFLKRIDFYLGFFLAYYLGILIFCILSIFGIISKMPTVNLVVFGVEMIPVLATLFLVIFKGAIINDFYKIYRGLMHDLHQILADMRSLDPSYFDINNLNNAKISNEVYSVGQQFSLTIHEHFFGKNDKRPINELRINYYDRALLIAKHINEQMNFEQNCHPFKVLGIPATMTTLKSMLAGVASALTISIKKLTSDE